jgi:N-acetylmuramoyl-L-alanine amidase
VAPEVHLAPSMNRLFVLVNILLVLGAVAFGAGLIAHLSPKNARRPVRESTRFIILHTTEGGGQGSLRKLTRHGEANFMVDEDGAIYLLIDDTRVARHAGRSMWNRLADLDLYSVGIEVVGYHNKPPNRKQKESLRLLLSRLQSKYGIPDERVLTHSMVAYGVPNAWHEYRHRGRKRCGMLMGTEKIRKDLGLLAKPKSDPDVDNRGLAVADPYLFQVLFGTDSRQVEDAVKVFKDKESNIISARRSAWFIARDRYDDSDTLYTLPNGSVIRGNQIRTWNSLPGGTKVSFVEEGVQVATGRESPQFEGFKQIGTHGNTAFSIARQMAASRTTVYFLPEPDGRIFTGQELAKNHQDLFNHLPRGTRILTGYFYGGHVNGEQTPFSIAGKKWNYPSTFYRLPNGQIVSGDEVEPTRIAPGTLVLFEI